MDVDIRIFSRRHTHPLDPMTRLLTLLLLVLAASSTSAQTFSDYLGRLEVGVGYGGLNLVSPRTLSADSATRSDDYEGLAVSLGWNWPIVKLADGVGIGVTLAGRFILSAQNGYYFPSLTGDGQGTTTDNIVHVNAPLIAMLKYGTDAHWEWSNHFGAGLGAGYQYVYHEGGIEYAQPIAVAELSVIPSGILRGVLKVQGVTDLGRNTYATDAFDHDYTAQSWGVYLLYTSTFGPQSPLPSPVAPPTSDAPSATERR
jgi:hypothetical protein